VFLPRYDDTQEEIGLVPIGYTHAHDGIMNRRDFDQMVNLLVGAMQKLDGASADKIRDFTP
jgi:putative aminopeptidase FrvX